MEYEISIGHPARPPGPGGPGPIGLVVVGCFECLRYAAAKRRFSINDLKQNLKLSLSEYLAAFCSIKSLLPIYPTLLFIFTYFTLSLPITLSLLPSLLICYYVVVTYY